MASTYIVHTGTMQTSLAAPPTITPANATLQTLMQLKGAQPFRVIQFGISFSQSSPAAAQPGSVELVDTGTVSCNNTLTAYGTGDIMPWGDPNPPANSSGSSGTPFNLSSTASGFYASGTDSSTPSINRILWSGLIDPVYGPFDLPFPQGREPGMAAGNILRFRVKFPTGVPTYAYMIVEL
jgi:hypothetical protein